MSQKPSRSKSQSPQSPSTSQSPIDPPQTQIDPPEDELDLNPPTLSALPTWLEQLNKNSPLALHPQPPVEIVSQKDSPSQSPSQQKHSPSPFNSVVTDIEIGVVSPFETELKFPHVAEGNLVEFGIVIPPLPEVEFPLVALNPSSNEDPGFLLEMDMEGATVKQLESDLAGAIPHLTEEQRYTAIIANMGLTNTIEGNIIARLRLFKSQYVGLITTVEQAIDHINHCRADAVPIGGHEPVEIDPVSASLKHKQYIERRYAPFVEKKAKVEAAREAWKNAVSERAKVMALWNDEVKRLHNAFVAAKNIVVKEVK